MTIKLDSILNKYAAFTNEPRHSQLKKNLVATWSAASADSDPLTAQRISSILEAMHYEEIPELAQPELFLLGQAIDAILTPPN